MKQKKNCLTFSQPASKEDGVDGAIKQMRRGLHSDIGCVMMSRITRQKWENIPDRAWGAVEDNR